MKMEHSIAAPFAGAVKDLFIEVGAQVAPGGLLMEITAA
jgi:geranyl-CoA carboxylase alpha subunit